MPKFTMIALLVSAAGIAFAAGAPANAQDKTCKVTVDRSQPSGTYSVQRQELDNGDCICYVYTGTQPQSDTIEQSIAALNAARACPDAPAVAVTGGEGAMASGGGGSGAALPLLGLAAVGVGVAV